MAHSPKNVPPLGHGSVVNDRYEIRQSLGKGGMGEVFLAYDRSTQQPVALKIVREESRMPGDDEALRQELLLARSVGHPNVCRVHDLAPSPWGPILVMEHIAGQTLHTHIRRRKAQGGYTADEFRKIASEAAAEWTAAKRGRRVVAPGRETTAPDPEAWTRQNEELRALVERLRGVPLDDRDTWATVARQTAGAFAAWSNATEETPGDLAAAADALSRSAQTYGRTVRPTKAGTVAISGAAMSARTCGKKSTLSKRVATTAGASARARIPSAGTAIRPPI